MYFNYQVFMKKNVFGKHDESRGACFRAVTAKKRVMKSTVLSLAALAYAAAGTAAVPEDAAADTLKAYALQDVQVVSTRAAKNTPVAFKNIGKEEIKNLNKGQDVPFLLSMTPSVTVTSDAGNGIGYTSLRVRGTDPTRINVTANGVPMNDAESATLYWVSNNDFISNVQSIQIQRGVGTSTNGAGAFGATVNMQTESIEATPFSGLDISAGSYYSHKETLRFGTGLINGRFGVQGRLSNIGSKGYLDRASSKLNSYFLQAGYFGDDMMVKFITWNSTEETYNAWNYTSKEEQRLYGRRYNSCGVYYDKDGKMCFYDDQNDVFHQQNYQLLWDMALGTNWNVSAVLHYTKGFGYYEEYKTKRTWAEYNLTDDWKMTGDLVRQKKMDNDLFGAIASANYTTDRLTATFGGGWNRYDCDHYGNVKWTGTPYYTMYDADGKKYKEYVTAPAGLVPGFEYYRNNAVKTDFNVYSKATWTFVKGLSAFTDLQYRHVGYEMRGPGDDWNWETMEQVCFSMNNKFDFFNPKFGLTWNPAKGHTAYVSVAVAHKEPTRNDYEDNIGSKLKAERLTDWEAGYKYQSPKFSAGANLYYMNYSDQFVLTGELNHVSEMVARNVGRSYRTGIELETAWQPADWFRWDANATLSRNRAKDWTVTLDDGTAAVLGDTPLSFSPDFLFNNVFSFSHKGIHASIMSRYVGEQYLTNTGMKSYTNYAADGTTQQVGTMLGDYFTTDINIACNFKVKSLGIKDATIGVTFYNIFSAKYDNNGWTAPQYKKDADGKVTAYCNDDLYEAGFAPSAPFNFMASMSLNF